MNMNVIDHVAAIPLFEGLPRKQHETLAMIALNRSYKKGQRIFSEGDEGVGFYVLISGRIKIFKLSPEGKEQILPMPRVHSYSFPGMHLSNSLRKIHHCL
jgi:CRP-like cAMP-binding protein